MSNYQKIKEILIKIAQTGIVEDSDIEIINEGINSPQKMSFQVGENVINIGKGEGIHIGDRYYNTWNEKVLQDLKCTIKYGESIKPKVREKQADYQNKIRELNNQTNEKLDQLESKYRDDLNKLETDFQNNLNRIKDEHRNSREREINRIVVDLENRKIRLEQYIEQLYKDWSDANSGWPASEEVNRGYEEQVRKCRQNLIKLENEIESFSQIGASIPSQGPTIPQVDKYFENRKAELNKNIVYKRY